MKRLAIILVVGIMVSSTASAQLMKGVVLRAQINNGDTLPVIDLPPVSIFAPLKFKNKQEEQKFTKLVKNVKRVYPFAKAAGIKFDEYNTLMAGVKSERARKLMMKKAEEQLRAEYESEMRRLSFSQGKLLIKLIDRQTSYTTFEVIKDWRGTLMASFWQGFGKIFGYNLKAKYDPLGEDKEVEYIIQMIEAGAI